MTKACLKSISDQLLADIPPVIIYVMEHDALKNDGQMMHKRIQSVGRSSQLATVEGAFHGQLLLAEQFMDLKPFKKTTKFCDDYIDDIKKYIQ